MRVRLETFSYRFAEQILNSKLAIKNEIENIIKETFLNLQPNEISRKKLNEVFLEKFQSCGWSSQPQIYESVKDISAKLDFMKSRIGCEVQFGHPSFIGIDLLKFQIASYSSLDTIDMGLYIVTTSNFQKTMIHKFGMKWNGSLPYEKVIKYLPYFKNAIQVPVYVIGIDI